MAHQLFNVGFRVLSVCHQQVVAYPGGNKDFFDAGYDHYFIKQSDLPVMTEAQFFAGLRHQAVSGRAGNSAFHALSTVHVRGRPADVINDPVELRQAADTLHFINNRFYAS